MNETTHYEGCWDSGPKHYECALLEVKKLRDEADAMEEFPRDVNHMNLRELEAMTLLHKQQIKDIAKHLLELKQEKNT